MILRLLLTHLFWTFISATSQEPDSQDLDKGRLVTHIPYTSHTWVQRPQEIKFDVIKRFGEGDQGGVIDQRQQEKDITNFDSSNEQFARELAAPRHTVRLTPPGSEEVGKEESKDKQSLNDAAIRNIVKHHILNTEVELHPSNSSSSTVINKIFGKVDSNETDGGENREESMSTATLLGGNTTNDEERSKRIMNTEGVNSESLDSTVTDVIDDIFSRDSSKLFQGDSVAKNEDQADDGGDKEKQEIEKMVITDEATIINNGEKDGKGEKGAEAGDYSSKVNNQGSEEISLQNKSSREENADQHEGVEKFDNNFTKQKITGSVEEREEMQGPGQATSLESESADNEGGQSDEKMDENSDGDNNSSERHESAHHMSTSHGHIDDEDALDEKLNRQKTENADTYSYNSDSDGNKIGGTSLEKEMEGKSENEANTYGRTSSETTSERKEDKSIYEGQTNHFKHMETHFRNISDMDVDEKLNFTILEHAKDYDLEEVPPLHLACTAARIFDSFPMKSDLNFSRKFGLESEQFNILNKYLNGNNIGERKIALNFPVFLTVTPKSNSTVERAICVWISEFSSLIPPEMDRHLGFLEIPQPRDEKVEIYASGKHFKYTKTVSGFPSDFMFRQQVKSLMDSIITSDGGESAEFNSYCIESFGTNKHTVSIRKKALLE